MDEPLRIDLSDKRFQQALKRQGVTTEELRKSMIMIEQHRENKSSGRLQEMLDQGKITEEDVSQAENTIRTVEAFLTLLWQTSTQTPH